MAKLNRATPDPPQMPSKAPKQPLTLHGALTSTPAAVVTLLSVIPTLKQLRDKKKAGSTLPNNWVFSSKGTILCDSLDLLEIANGFLKFYKQQSDISKPALIKHLQLLMEHASTYTSSSVRSFLLAIATAIEWNRLVWSRYDVICENFQTFFTHQDLHMQSRFSGTKRPQSQAGQQIPIQRSASRFDQSQ